MNAILSRITRFVEPLGPKLSLALVLLLALTLLVGIYLGRHAAYNDMNVAPQTLRSVRLELSTLREALKVAQGDLQMQDTRHEVDSRALELVRSEMAAEKARTADLEEGLSFYRSMLVSVDLAGGLSLRKPELVPSGSPGRFSYRIFVQHKTREYEMVEGTLSVEVFGFNGEEKASYSLNELSAEFGAGAAALYFLYFQAIEGELVLPQGFEPRGMTVVARAIKPRETEIREQFPWELQERFINVGK